MGVFHRTIATGLLDFVEVQRNGMGGVSGIGGAFALAVSGDGKHLYVAGSTDNALAVFRRNSSSGVLTFVQFLQDEVGTVKGLSGASSVAVSPDGANVYAAGPGDAAVPVFSRNASTGVLTFRERAKEALGAAQGLAGVDGLASSPDGLHVYAAGATDGAVAALRRDPTFGTVSFVGVQQDGVGGVDGLAGASAVGVSADGAHVYVAGAADNALAVFGRDAVTGDLLFVEAQVNGIGGVAGLGGASGVALSPDGAHVYATGATDGAVAVFARNAGTGALGFVEAQVDGVGGVDGLDGASGVAVSPDGAHVYVTGAGDAAVAVFARDGITGALTFVEAQVDGVGGVDGLAGASAVAVSPDGAHVYVTGASDGALAVFARNGVTGALTFVQVHLNGVGGVRGLAGARAVLASPDGSTVYVAGATEGTVAVFARDASSGALTFVEQQPHQVGGTPALAGAAALTMSPDGRHVYAGGAVGNAVVSFRVIVCGDGLVDPGEQCDDGNTAGGDCCSATCAFELAGGACAADADPCTSDVCDGAGVCTHPDSGVCPRCGNGRLDPGEQCDDGNTVSGDCCSGGCRFEPAGSGCPDDGNACTAESCDGAGRCLALPVVCDACETCDPARGCIPAPRTACHRPIRRAAALLRLRNSAADKLDRLLWRWQKGDATTLGEFGDPTDMEDYALCVYGQVAGEPLLYLSARAPADGRCGPRPCWQGRFRYRDPARTPDGLAAVTLHAGTAGKARVVVRGAGPNLRLPALPAALPLRVQLQAESGPCWEASYDAALRNDETGFRARGD